MKKRFTEEQIIKILQEGDYGEKVKEICRRHGMSEASYYKWKSKYGGLERSDLYRLRHLESENAKLKVLLAEAVMDNRALKDVISKNW